MKPAPFKYYDPSSIDEALELLAALENTKVLAGGQSLMPMLNFRYLQPDHLIDLNNIGELAGIGIEKQALSIGAMTRQRELERSTVVAEACPMLPLVLTQVGNRQTRNRGTIGGSLCHLDPSAELVNCASLHDGTRLVASSASLGTREFTFDEFAEGYMSHGLRGDEILVRVVLPIWSSRHGYGFVEVAPRKGDFALAAVGTLIEIDGASGAISRAAISISGASAVPTRPAAAERMLVGERASKELFLAASNSIEIDAPLSDAYATSDYRLHLARVLTRRALTAAADKAAERWGHA